LAEEPAVIGEALDDQGPLRPFFRGEVVKEEAPVSVR